MTLIPPGRYRHYKGDEYLVLFVATHSETKEPLVVYRRWFQHVEFPCVEDLTKVWVRPASMWFDLVTTSTGTTTRFTFIQQTG